MSRVQISNQGIKKALKKISMEEAVAEYIWNGFDAQATAVELRFTSEEPFGQVTTLSIVDNGKGIPASQLEKKFTPFFESEKAIKRREENIGLEGKNGYGRLTFYKFAGRADWQTTYAEKKSALAYGITIQADSLDNYKATSPAPVKEKAGTTVVFTQLADGLHREYLIHQLRPFLLNEFAWYLEMNKQRGVQLFFQGEPLSCGPLMADQEEFRVVVDKDPSKKERWVFDCTYVQWKSRLNDEYSRFYFLTEDGKFRYKMNSRLNKKGDNFYHSVIIKSTFFDHLVIYDENEDDEAKPTLFSENAPRKVFRMLTEKLHSFLRKKRKPFLQASADGLVQSFEKDEVMPVFGNNPWDRMRKSNFEALLRGLYKVEPGLFTQLNNEQKKTLLNLLNLVLDSDERDNLFPILENIVEMDAEDRATLRDVLKTTRLTNVTQAMKLVSDRMQAIAVLRELVFNHNLKANERDHLQRVMEAHYWILGEQYTLVCAAEAKFETALWNYVHILRGTEPAGGVDHPDRLKEMDIFLVRQLWGLERLNNVVVELKSPSSVKMLSMKHLNQVKTYMDVILSIDEFNAQSNCSWDFYLIGQDYDGPIANEKKNAEHHGIQDLVFKVSNYRIYVKRWSEVFIDVELRLKWLNDQLKMERERLVGDPKTAGEAVEKVC